jgi:hypothetical protein
MDFRGVETRWHLILLQKARMVACCDYGNLGTRLGVDTKRSISLFCYIKLVWQVCPCEESI